MLNLAPDMSALVSEFCQWLLQDNSPKASLTSIVLHGKAEIVSDRLVEEISRYLNEYDDEAGGCWLGASRALLGAIAADSNLTRMMDLGGCCGCRGGCCSKAEPSEDQKQAVILKALAARGHLVFRAPAGHLELPTHARAFHAGIGERDDIADRCHITVDPDMIDTGRLPQIVADVYLEWNHSHGLMTPPTREA